MKIINVNEEIFKDDLKGKILIITGGTSDIPVADEEYYTAKSFGLLVTV